MFIDTKVSKVIVHYFSMSLLISKASSSLHVKPQFLCSIRYFHFFKYKTIHRPGDGVNFKKNPNETEENKEEDPFDYDLFGNKRFRRYSDYFHYSDRPAASGGYSHFTNEGLFGDKRVHIYPPVQRLFKIGNYAIFFGTFLLLAGAVT